MDLKKLISNTESETIEFKESTGEWKEIIETISAFSNTKGGKIVIGVSKSDKLPGVDIGKDNIENLTNQISQNTDPKIHLFAKDLQKFFPQVKIRAGRLKGTDGLDFIDMKVLEGTIPELREKAMKFIMDHIRHGVFFDANRRYDRWEYP